MMRTTVNHWRQLRQLLDAYERCFESCARLDAHRRADRIQTNHTPGPDYAHGRARAEVERRLDALTRRVEHELDCVTAERLIAELERRQWADSHNATGKSTVVLHTFEDLVEVAS